MVLRAVLLAALAITTITTVACGDDGDTNPGADASVSADASANAADSSVSGADAATSSIDIRDGETAADGCTIVNLNTSLWAPIHTGYTSGADPFFQLHDNEAGFYFNVELYTVYGNDWTGQLGTFATDCTNTGICAYLCPMDTGCYLAAATGSVEITALSESGGTIQSPADITLRNLTLQGINGATGCYHVDQVRLQR